MAGWRQYDSSVQVQVILQWFQEYSFSPNKLIRVFNNLLTAVMWGIGLWNCSNVKQSGDSSQTARQMKTDLAEFSPILKLDFLATWG